MTNAEYVKQRNGCIPEAGKYANEVAGPEPEDKKELKEWKSKWDKAFFTRMDLLSKANVLKDAIEDLKKVAEDTKSALFDKKAQLRDVQAALNGGE